MRIHIPKRMSIPKVAVLATGLAAAVMVTTINPAPVAQALPDYGTTCSGCHTLGATVLATPSLATLEPGAPYEVDIAITSTASGNSGYNISDAAGTSILTGGPAAGSTHVAPMKAPATAGTYTYTVSAAQGRPGAWGTTTYSITVASAPVATAPVASFTTSVASGDFPLPVTMTDTSTNTPTSWSWDLGDGITSTLQNPAVSYATAGPKTVTLVATNAGGASAMVSKTITVTTPAPAATAPVAGFNAAATGLTAAMTDTSTNAPTEWSWDFGNGAISTSQNPSVTYATAGTYPVTLTAGNSAGSSSVTIAVTVSASTPLPSTAVIHELSPDKGRVGSKVEIEGSGFGTPGVVQFDTANAKLLSWSAEKIVVIVPSINSVAVSSDSDARTPVWYRHDQDVLVTVTPEGAAASNGVEFELKSSRNHDGDHDGDHDHEGDRDRDRDRH